MIRDTLTKEILSSQVIILKFSTYYLKWITNNFQLFKDQITICQG